MKIRNGFSLRPLGNEFILLAESAELVNFNKMLTLNESAAYLFRKAEGKDFEAKDLVAWLLEEYEVSEEQAAADADKLIASWQESGILA